MKVYLTYRERIAGFFLLSSVALVILFFVGAAIENRWFVPTTSYHMHVTRGEGLRPGSPVLLSGIQVGDIEALNIMADNRIDVKLSIIEKYADRITWGTTALVQRTLAIGEKRILLVSPPGKKTMPPESIIPAEEPKDLLDVVSSVDLGRYLDTMDKAVASMDLLLSKLEEDNRMVRMIEAFDELGPTLSNVNSFIVDIHEPFVELIRDPSMRQTFRGAAKVFNDPNLKPMIHNMAKSFDPEKVNALIDKTDTLISSLDKVLAPGGAFQETFNGMERIVNDKRIDKMLSIMLRLTDEQKIEKLLSNLTTLSSQMARIGPEIPEMSKSTISTMKELTIVLKAMQRSWLLDDETKAVLKEMKRSKEE